ncbi:MAG: putative DNA-binding domain-containing protein [Paracoccaceae bacterium]|nr:putative DNA-binding domain-containing protein [Paracoccaceae bacterium]
MTQPQFRAALLDPNAPPPPGLTDPQGRPAGRRFDVYRNNVTQGLTDALTTSFPILVKLLGEAFFRAMARHYLRAHPPTSPLMMFYGDNMPAFLETFAPAAHLGYLPDVARLELALRHSYHAADHTPVRAEALAALAPEVFLAARLTLAPSLRLIRSDWPLHAIWRVNTEPGAPNPEARAEDVLITRVAFDPTPQLLPQGAAPFLEALIRGNSVAEAIAPAEEFNLTATLSLLLSTQSIAALTLEETP